MTTQTADRTPSPAADDETPLNPAETYERYMVPTLFAPAAEELLAVARPQPGERVLDVGTGTGIVARRAVPRVMPDGAVTGLDASAGMLSVARAMADAEGVAITWQEGRAEALPYPDEAFALVLSQFALMFFADRAAALAEMRRVLAPGGRVAQTVFQGIDRHTFYVALDKAITRHLGTSVVGAIFSLGDTGALRDALTQAGLREVAIERRTVTARFPDPGAFLAGEIDVDTASIPAMQHLDPPARHELTKAIAAEMTEPLRAATEGDHVVLPFHLLIARASR
jgi:SAM-dependent methyltransferase